MPPEEKELSEKLKALSVTENPLAHSSSASFKSCNSQGKVVDELSEEHDPDDGFELVDFEEVVNSDDEVKVDLDELSVLGDGSYVEVDYDSDVKSLDSMPKESNLNALAKPFVPMCDRTPKDEVEQHEEGKAINDSSLDHKKPSDRQKEKKRKYRKYRRSNGNSQKKPPIKETDKKTKEGQSLQQGKHRCKKNRRKKFSSSVKP